MIWSNSGGQIFVRMLVPPVVLRRKMDRDLVGFFRDHQRAAFRRAVSEFCGFFGLKRPRIEWYEYIDWGKTAGKTFEDGRIHLVHPENWKRGRVYKSERMWVQMVYHELAHYLFWSDPESKAEAFTHRMVRGLRRVARNYRAVGARGSVRRVAVGSRRATAGNPPTRRRVATNPRTQSRQAVSRTRTSRMKFARGGRRSRRGRSQAA